MKENKAKLNNKKFLLMGVFVFIFAISVFLVSVPKAEAATVTSTATGGDWTTGSTWVGGSVPANSDIAVIATTGANSVTIGANNKINTITVNSGAILSFTDAFTLTINGNLAVSGTVNGATGILK